jgi:hypothetical protein
MRAFGASIGLAAALAQALPAGRALGQSGPWALPGLGRVGAAATGDAPVTMAASAGYGYLGDVLDDGGAHHRAAGGLAASFRALDWLAISGRLDGRYDRHQGDRYGSDGSGVVEPRLTARAAVGLGSGIRAGGELGLWFPGEDGPELKAISPRALGLLSIRHERLTLHGNAGFHLDRSGRSVEAPAELQPWDRASLDVSDAPAILLGAGAEVVVGPGAIWGEASWDLLVGAEAPPLARSPLHAGAGVRYPLGRPLDLYAFLEVNLAERELGTMDALVPLGARIAATVAVAYRFETTVPPRPRAEAAPAPAAPAPPRAAAPDRNAPGRPDAGEPSGERPLPEGQIRGTVLGFDGKPLAARITIEPGGLTVTADAAGAFEVDVPPGEYQVTVEMPRFQTARRRVRVEQRGVTLLPIDLKRK